MPSLRVRAQQPSPVPPQVELPPEFPDIPQEVLDRFPEAAKWQQRLDEFWDRTKQAIQGSQTQAANYANARVVYNVDQFLIYAKGGIPQPMFALDSTGVKLGDVLVINTPGRKVYIGVGEYDNDNTPFYVDTLGRFSLGANLNWDPETATLDITGIINATSGTIGGFEIGPDYIRDTANSFGLASTVTVSPDVRFWAGDTFANRATAPLRITEDGTIYCAAGSSFGVSPVEPSRVLRVDGVDPDGLGPVRIGVVGSATFLGAITALAPSLNAGQDVYIALGVAASSNDWAGWAFRYAGTGSTSNELRLVFFGGSPVFKVSAAGVVNIAALAGVGTRTVVADASGNLSAP